MLEKRIEEVRRGAALPMELRRIRLADLTALILTDYEQSNRRSARRVREAIAHLHRGFDDGKFPVADLSGNRISEHVADRLASRDTPRRHRQRRDAKRGISTSLQWSIWRRRLIQNEGEVGPMQKLPQTLSTFADAAILLMIIAFIALAAWLLAQSG